jgi:hypothetical protein
MAGRAGPLVCSVFPFGKDANISDASSGEVSALWCFGDFGRRCFPITPQSWTVSICTPVRPSDGCRFGWDLWRAAHKVAKPPVYHKQSGFIDPAATDAPHVFDAGNTRNHRQDVSTPVPAIEWSCIRGFFPAPVHRSVVSGAECCFGGGVGLKLEGGRFASRSLVAVRHGCKARRALSNHRA